MDRGEDLACDMRWWADHLATASFSQVHSSEDFESRQMGSILNAIRPRPKTTDLVKVIKDLTNAAR